VGHVAGQGPPLSVKHHVVNLGEDHVQPFVAVQSEGWGDAQVHEARSLPASLSRAPGVVKLPAIFPDQVDGARRGDDNLGVDRVLKCP